METLTITPSMKRFMDSKFYKNAMNEWKNHEEDLQVQQEIADEEAPRFDEDGNEI
jgi:hypothetical protein